MFRRLIFTLDELHDDVDGLSLGAHTNQPHNVRMVVLLQVPGQHDRQKETVCICDSVCVCVCA